MCECCDRARGWARHPVHCPTCLPCGARLIQSIQRLPIPREAKIDRCRKVLADWMAHGHSEAEIRRLAKLEAMPLAPESSVVPGRRGG